MPRIKHTQVFKFEELSDSAKEKAREWYREGAFDYDWWDSVYDDAKRCLALAGFDVDRIYFSGFWSQGDGACFEGAWKASDVKPGALKAEAPQDVDLHAIAAEMERIAAAFPNASARVKHTGRYNHEYSTSFDVELAAPEDDDDVERTTAEWDALAKAREPFETVIVETSRKAMRWIYRQLEKEYNYLNSDEQVDESIQANEYEFTEEGKRA